MKVYTIKLSDMHPNPKVEDNTDTTKRLFRVEQITDCVKYHTGQFLDRAEVEHLCGSNAWKVTIVPAKL